MENGPNIEAAVPAHTPGPWTVSAYHEDIVFADGEQICAMHRGNTCFAHEKATETSIANARVAAAAPELLEALEDVLSYFAPNGFSIGALPVVRAQAAINKALGRAQSK